MAQPAPFNAITIDPETNIVRGDGVEVGKVKELPGGEKPCVPIYHISNQNLVIGRLCVGMDGKYSVILELPAEFGGFKEPELNVNISEEELNKIIRKIEILEKIGVEIRWNELLDGDFPKNLLKELKKEIDELNKKLLG